MRKLWIIPGAALALSITGGALASATSQEVPPSKSTGHSTSAPTELATSITVSPSPSAPKVSSTSPASVSSVTPSATAPVELGNPNTTTPGASITMGGVTVPNTLDTLPPAPVTSATVTGVMCVITVPLSDGTQTLTYSPGPQVNGTCDSYALPPNATIAPEAGSVTEAP